MKASEQFDFRMDKSSWVMILFMIFTFAYFWLEGGVSLPFIDYLQGFGFSFLIVLILIAIMSIPVLIYCYFVKMIPDIDYSIRAAFVFTLIGIASEFLF